MMSRWRTVRSCLDHWAAVEGVESSELSDACVQAQAALELANELRRYGFSGHSMVWQARRSLREAKALRRRKRVLDT